MNQNSRDLARQSSFLKKSFSWIASLCCAVFFISVTPAYASSENEKKETTVLQAQEKKILGNVVDKNGESLIGVNIIVKGTTTGTITDFDGNYEISVPENSTLVFSFIGYLNQEIVVTDNATINISLLEDALGLDEVIVVGYGTQKKANLTGSVSAVKGDEMVKKPMTDARQALQGVSTGVTIR